MEIKSRLPRLPRAYVTDFLQTLACLFEFFGEHRGRAVEAAVGLAIRRGLLVFVPARETVRAANPPGFVPRDLAA